jgi:hypothetical protein
MAAATNSFILNEGLITAKSQELKDIIVTSPNFRDFLATLEISGQKIEDLVGRDMRVDGLTIATAAEKRQYSVISLIGRSLQERVKTIRPADPFYATAQKVNRVVGEILGQTAPVLQVLEKASEKIRHEYEILAKETRLENTPENQAQLLAQARAAAKGMYIIDWLAIYLDDLNKASATGDRDGMMTAIKLIQNCKLMMAQQGKPMPRTEQFYALCAARIEELDSDGSMRKELSTCTGRVWGTVKKTVGVAAAIVLPIALVAGAIYGITSVESAIRNTVFSYFNGQVTQAALTAMSANFLYIAVKMRSKVFGAIAGINLVRQLTSLS